MAEIIRVNLKRHVKKLKYLYPVLLLVLTCGLSGNPDPSEVTSITSKGMSCIYGSIPVEITSMFNPRTDMAVTKAIDGKIIEKNWHWGARPVTFELKNGPHKILLGVNSVAGWSFKYWQAGLEIYAETGCTYVVKARQNNDNYAMWVENAKTHEVISAIVNGQQSSKHISPSELALIKYETVPGNNSGQARKNASDQTQPTGSSEITSAKTNASFNNEAKSLDKSGSSEVSASDTKVQITTSPEESYSQIVNEGKNYLENNDPASAYRDAVTAMAQSPDQYQAYALAAFALEQKGAHDAARKMIEKAIDHAPEDKTPSLINFKNNIQNTVGENVSDKK